MQSGYLRILLERAVWLPANTRLSLSGRTVEVSGYQLYFEEVDMS